MPTDAPLNSLLKLFAHDPDNRLLRGRCVEVALQQRDFATAERLAREALARDATDAQGWFELASAQMGQRDFALALDSLGRLTTGDHIDPAVHQNIGLCHYLLGHHAEARVHLEAVYRSGVRSADVLRLLISALHHLGDMEAARPMAEEAAEVGRTDAGLAGVLALLYLDDNNSAQAARWAARALQLNPHSVDGLVVQGTLRTSALEMTTARAQFKQALDIAPHAGRAWVGLSLISLSEQDFAQAQSQVEQGLQYMATHVGSWHILAWIHLLQGRLDDARATFEKALSLDRNFAESHGGLAAIAALQGDREAAERLIAVAERLDPACLSSQFARSVLLRGTGDPGAAQALLMAALGGLSPKDGGAISKMIAGLTRK